MQCSLDFILLKLNEVMVMVCGGGCAQGMLAQFNLSPLFPPGSTAMEGGRCASVILLKTSGSRENTCKYESVTSSLSVSCSSVNSSELHGGKKFW